MGCTASTSTEDQSGGKSLDKAPSSDAGLDDHHEPYTHIQNAALYAHNHYREEHGAPPLKLNKDLCELAEQLAKRMAKSEQLDKSISDARLHKGEVCGENLFWKEDDGLPIIGDCVVKSWYNEREAYNYDEPAYVEAAAHFTQLIWSSAKEMGMATATSERGSSAVAVYYPAGNKEGQYGDNVKPKVS